LLGRTFGDKRLHKRQEYYTIEPFVKRADIYISNDRFSQEIIFDDTVGLNQGQNDIKRLKEVAINRVSAALVEHNPDIILYHTKLADKDDYLVDIVKKLAMDGFGKNTYVIAGRLDTVLQDCCEDENLELDEMNEEKFNHFITEIEDEYVASDKITLSSMIEDRYYVCDKKEKVAKKLQYMCDYTGRAVLGRIIESYSKSVFYGVEYDDEQFMGLIKRNHLCERIYQEYLRSIPRIIPMDYNDMRWNTLQKALEDLYAKRWGFDVLCPAISVRSIISSLLDNSDVRNEFYDIFGDNADDVKKRFLLHATEVAQIVLVTEFRTFMTRLLKMRYESALRTDLSTSMTNDRKSNLQRLYKTCMEQEGLRGEYSMEVVIHIAWLRTLEQIHMESKIN
jgi:hypothetical protein